MKKQIFISICLILLGIGTDSSIINTAWAQDFTLESFSIQSGYITGDTAYDFNHHTSELEFPMDNWMIGAGLTLLLERYNSSLNIEFWTPIEKETGSDMEDKDWDSSGALTSFTKSRADMQAIITDINLRYDFYKNLGVKKENKIGLLLGFKYERFDYDMFDILYLTQSDNPSLEGQTTNEGQKVLTYRICYYLPYIGLVADISNKKWGIGLDARYSFYPTAEDVDNHLLRNLTFYTDYDQNGEAWMTGIHGFWNFTEKWKLKIGADATFIRIDGRIWEENHDPAWDADQSTDAKHWLFWMGIEYKF